MFSGITNDFRSKFSVGTGLKFAITRFCFQANVTLSISLNRKERHATAPVTIYVQVVKV
jgi:hypothetical protein